MKHNYHFSITALLLSALVLAACSDSDSGSSNTTDNVDTGTSTETEAVTLYALPNQDFGGEAVNIISTDYPTCASLAMEETGDVLDDAKYQMKRTVEEALNVVIFEDTSTGHWDMNAHLQSLIMAGDTTFDIVSMMDRFALSAAMENSFLPIQDIEGIHLDAPYWGEFSDALTINGNQYFAAVSCNLVSFRRAACMMMNMRLAGQYDIEIPYEDVRAGTWTWDDLMALKGIATQDLNGDGVFDGNDQYTFDSTDTRLFPMQLWIASDIHFVNNNADGVLQVAIYDDEKFVEVFERAQNLLFTGENNISFGSSSSENVYSSGLFGKGQALLAFGQLMNLESYRELEDDFAVLPMPKYDETQENYHAQTYDLQFFCIPVTQDDVELSAAVTDALCCVGYYDLLPVYKETVLKDKFARDETSKEMLQLIFDTRTFEASEMYVYDQFGGQFIYNNILERNISLVTMLERQRKAMDKQLNKIMDAFADMESLN